MAEHAGVTRWQVHQIWKAADLKPDRLRTFKISNAPLFAEKVCDVVGLYVNPLDNALVLSVDEKTQIQALDRTQPKLQLRPGHVERRTHDYKRHGTISLYAAFNTLTGQVIGRITQCHRAKEFLDFLRQVDRETPKDLGPHFTPTSASLLNAVVGWFGLLEVSVHSRTPCHPAEFRPTVTSHSSTRGYPHEKTPHPQAVAGPA
tara:strand:- start:402 stop:1010 length:609 start_codon:yes stop_codon:yes gene_type:complete